MLYALMLWKLMVACRAACEFFGRNGSVNDRSVDFHCYCRTTVWVKKNPEVIWHFSFFHKRLRIFNRFFTHILYVPIYARWQIFIQLSPTLTKLCHITRDYLVHVICSKYQPSADTDAFRRLRKSLIAVLIVICGKSSQICCFYNVNKHVGYDMTSTETSFAQ